MNLAAENWWDRVQGSKGILRHYDAVEDIEPLLLAHVNYDLRSLDVELVSLTPPLRLASRWSKRQTSGACFKLRVSTTCASFEDPVHFQETEIKMSVCPLEGVAWQEGHPFYVELEGVTFRLVQGVAVVVQAERSSVRLTGISPIDAAEAAYYRNPERYA